jgi:UDP-galactopyranose mutase
MLGPVVKIDAAALPQAPTLHYLGMKSYDQLPGYLAGWDVAIMPFAHNEATRYISPTKTPEYLAAGLPVASTGIHDVVEPYERRGLVEIGDGPEDFLFACERALATDLADHQAKADLLLSQMSWDRTWAAIDGLLTQSTEARTTSAASELTRAEPRVVRPAASRRTGLRPPAPRVAVPSIGGVQVGIQPDRSAAALE